MTIDEFCNKWNIKSEALYVKNEGIFTPYNSKIKYVDEFYFTRRKDFALKVRSFNQSMLYYLEEHFSISDIARNISEYSNKVNRGTVEQFLRIPLFMLDDRTIITSTIGKSEWAVFRFFRSVLFKLNKIFGFKIDVEKILDRRMSNG